MDTIGNAADPEDVFVGDGEMARRMRAFDWATTPLGPVESWSASLRMMVKFLLANRFPLLLWWGPQYISIYNDPYRPVLGTKHPWALGQPVSECWREIWPILQPLIDTPFNGGPATWDDDIFLEVNRHGFVEETHFTIAYSPVPDETVPGGVGGVLATVHEITQQVVQERRLAVLRDLGARSAEAKTAEEAGQIAAEAFGRHPKDVPFALIYLIDEEQRSARLAGAAGVEPGEPSSPTVVDLGAVDEAAPGWSLASAMEDAQPRLIENLEACFGGAVPSGPWPDRPNRALVLPVPSNVPRRLAGFLVLGISARLELDDLYRGFCELATAQVATAIANAHAYEEERKRAEALAELDRAKTTFFSNVSHEFRTPLTLSLGPVDDALADVDHPLPAEQRERLEVVQRNHLRLLKLVNTLLDFSRIEAGRVQAVYEPTDLAAATIELASVFRSAIERASLRLIVDCPPLSQPVYVDRDMWEKIVLNLLSNAFKFTFEGEIAVRVREEGEMVVLEVRDSGVGIAVEELPRVFERFHRIAEVRARTHEGSGIGLALVQELARLHGGTVEVASVLGEGSAFTVSLPLGTAHLPIERIQARRTLPPTTFGATPYVAEALRWLPEEAGTRPHPGLLPEGEETLVESLLQFTESSIDPVPRSLSPPGEGQGEGAPPRPFVLVADDNADLRDYLRRLLAGRYDVEVAANGAAALEAARTRPPDLVLADVMMPELDGFGLLRALHGDPRTRAIPVILLSARAGEEATVEGLESGADDYLVKPFSAREVLARVGARLEIARLRREASARAIELRSILDLLPVGVAVVDAKGRVVVSNQAVKAIWGEGVPLAESRDDYGRYPATWAETGEPIGAEEWGLARALATGEVSRLEEIDIVAYDGARRTILNSSAPLRDEAGKIVGGMSVMVDVTERKRLERQTRDALEALLQIARALVAIPETADSPGHAALDRHIADLLRQIFPVRYASFFTVTPGSEVLELRGLAGYPPELEPLVRQRTTGRPLSARIPDAEQRSRLLAGDVVVLDLTEPRYREQQSLYGVTQAVIVPMHVGEQFVGTLGMNPPEGASLSARELALARGVARMVALVVERDRLLHEREEARGQALAFEETTRRMDEFMGIAAHELRTPLTAISGNIQLAERQFVALSQATRLEDGDPPSSEKLGRMRLQLGRAIRQVARLDRLVSDLLDSSRIQAGKLELRPESCDLLAIVREAVEGQRPAWPNRDIPLELPDSGEPVLLYADADRVGQVVTNYLTNALKYSAANEPVVLRVRVRERQARVEVHDFGPGLSVEQREHLFERFYRAPGIEQLSGSGIGLGLGLHICKTVVERHGGAVGVESDVGKGSTFWFTLPLDEGRS